MPAQMFWFRWLLCSSSTVNDTMIERLEIKVNGFALVPWEGYTLFRENQQQDEPYALTVSLESQKCKARCDTVQR